MEAIEKSRWSRCWRLPALGLLAVAGILLLPGIAPASDIPTAAGAASAAGASSATGWKSAPVLPVIKGKDKRKLLQRVARGRRLGMRATFAKVGDSNIEMTPALYGLGCADPTPGLSPSLERTLRRYSRVRLANQRAFPGCERGNSFSRRSAAARSGTFSDWSLIPGTKLPDTGYLAFPTDCELEQTPLGCELEASRPRYAFVLTGTNDSWFDRYLGKPPGSLVASRLKRVTTALLAAGTVPVLTSIPPKLSGKVEDQPERDRFVERSNRRIRALARKMHFPFINLWRALVQPQMINRGMSSDGLHLSLYNAGGAPHVLELGPTTFADSVVFTPEGLRYGSNRRNLIVLKTLARLDRITG